MLRRKSTIRTSSPQVSREGAERRQGEERTPKSFRDNLQMEALGDHRTQHPRHIHFCILATPRDSISYVMQIIKGKSSAWLKKKIKRANGLYEKESLWARGYFVSTIGIDEWIIRRYVKHQHHHNQLAQRSLFDKL